MKGRLQRPARAGWAVVGRPDLSRGRYSAPALTMGNDRGPLTPSLPSPTTLYRYDSMASRKLTRITLPPPPGSPKHSMPRLKSHHIPATLRQLALTCQNSSPHHHLCHLLAALDSFPITSPHTNTTPRHRGKESGVRLRYRGRHSAKPRPPRDRRNSSSWQRSTAHDLNSRPLISSIIPHPKFPSPESIKTGRTGQYTPQGDAVHSTNLYYPLP